jgi:hypothetical protein
MIPWDKYILLFGLSTFKFMVAPLGGIPMKLSFWETYFSCILGAIFCASFFYFLSGYFIKRAAKKRRAQFLITGLYSTKKKFTRINKTIIKIKKTFGIVGICLFAPFFLSIPGGTIIVAKFYGGDKKAFPLVILGILLNGLVVTTLVYSKQIFDNI